MNGITDLRRQVPRAREHHREREHGHLVRRLSPGRRVRLPVDEARQQHHHEQQLRWRQFATAHHEQLHRRQQRAEHRELREQLGLRPGQQTGAAGNPIDISYDWSSTLGGPIKRDKAWFFGAIRRWRLDQFQIGALNPDGSQAIDDNRIENATGWAWWDIPPSTYLSPAESRRSGRPHCTS